jgi:Ca2+-binding RTX toxin-like protein
MATSFLINTADLAFILKQIKIAENTSIGYTPIVPPVSMLQAIMDAYGLDAANAAIAPFGLRTVDGSFNNLLPGQSHFGAADTPFPRLTNPVFRNDTDGDAIDFDGPGGQPPVVQGNYGQAGTVVDADPRIISNLIVDMSVNNPAAIDAFLNNPLSVAHFEEIYGFPPDLAWFTDPAHVVEANELLQTIPNQSPDIGLTAGFNSWMTFFGQFFDHGLDLVTKGGNETVYIPLQPDDPLIAGADGILVDDPLTLVDEAADNLPLHLRFMALTRATPTMVDPDGAGPLPAVAQHENTTTSFIDQNQTYTSHASHQVFLREYKKDSNNHAVSTGRLLDGTATSGSVAGAVGNWAEVKKQALEYLGINLSDFDVHNVPLLLTDQYGKFIPGANGFAQIVMAPDATHATLWYKEGNSDGSVTTAGSIGTNHAFLNDIAHHAAPSFVDHDHNPLTPKIQQVADSDIDVDGDGIYEIADGDSIAADFNGDLVIDGKDFFADDHDELTYDDEMLNAHFITGDGRGNENIALTAVHSIFHSEHNRAVEANKDTLIASGDAAVVNEWLLPGPGNVRNQITQTQLDAINAMTDLVAKAAAIDALNWDGERLFQAARFTTEMQYQHLVFEEFARRIQPSIDPFVFNNSPNVDPSILAEFAHTVYRFGHSMLTGTVDRLENNLTGVGVGDPDQATLLAMFLNPQAYVGSGATLEEINANLIRGLSRDVGNAMDEFIVTDVRSNLLGLPLDLAALNIARGRDTGIPSLNETRRQLYNDTSLADLKPYESWVDFGRNIKNAASLVNFVAAYGTHSTITSATTLADKRAAAELLVFDDPGSPIDRLDFMNATGAYAGGSLGGLNDVDLWIGGLAEANPEFGGMLGSTFNYVFEAQMENLQNGDRLYYLSRTQGTNLLNQLEPNTFSDLVMRNTDLGDKYATHLNGALFVTPDLFIELDRGIAQTDYNGAAPGNDPSSVTRNYNVPGYQQVEGNHDFGGYLRFVGGEHTVLGGTEGNDTIYGDKGDDTLWGDGGNDYLNGGTAADDVFGGEGDDIIEDPFGDDVLRGNQGNDVISSARGIDLLFGDQGTDVILLGQDASEVFAGTGDDFILGGVGADALLGNEGNDWIEGGAGFDGVTGDNSELFFNSPIIGHDVLFGHGDETDFDAESGDDIMASAGSTVVRYEGMFGFDWGIAKNDNTAVRYDLLPNAIAAIPGNVLRDRFDNVEAASGWKNSDQLLGDNRGHVIGAPQIPILGPFAPATPDAQFYSDTPVGVEFDNLLHAEGVDRITGFNTWFGNARQTLFGSNTADFRDGNILMGGDGNDFFTGRGGFDLIDGDAWLNVRIKIVIPTGPNAGTYSAESLTTEQAVAGPNAGKVYNVDANGNPNFASPAFGGVSLTALLLNRTINPGQMSVVREIKYDDTDTLTGAAKNIDTAIYQGTIAQYEIEGRDETGQATDLNGDGFIYIRDLDNGVTRITPGTLTADDTDLIKNIEQLQFTNQSIRIDSDIQWNGVTPADTALPLAGAVIANLSTLEPTPSAPYSYAVAAGSDANFTVSAAGAVTAIAAMAANTTSTVNVTSTSANGGTVTESFTIRTGTLGGDNFTGGSTDDVFYGLNGNDILNGGSGNDNLFGQQGTDTLNGGGGNDNLVGGTGNDVVNGGLGNDTIRYTVDVDGTDTVDGGANQNGNDTLVLTSGAGNQTLTATYSGTSLTNVEGGTVANVESITADLGIGTDTLVYTAPGGVTVNLSTGSASGFTSISNIENVTGNGGADTLTGDGNINVLTGGADADTLNGGGGADTINGNAGDDTILYTVGDGNDTVNGGADIDTLQVSSGAGNESISVTYNGVSITNIAGVAVAAVESVTAALGAGVDTLTYTGNTAVSINLAAGTASGFTSISNIENVTTGGGIDILIGNSVANALNGGGAGDVINGDGGDDTLNGGAGNDALLGGADNDLLVGGLNTDTLTGGIGNDIFRFNASNESLSGPGVRDIITDFLVGTDVIDLNAIDANTVAGGNQAFVLTGAGGTGAFTAAGQLRFIQIDTDGVGGVDSTRVLGNTNANTGTIEFEVLLQNYLNPLVAANFVL